MNCPKCKQRIRQEAPCTRTFPDGTSLTYRPQRCGCRTRKLRPPSNIDSYRGFGRWAILRCWKLGLTAAEVSQRAGRDASYLHTLGRLGYPPPRDIAVRIGELLGDVPTALQEARCLPAGLDTRKALEVLQEERVLARTGLQEELERVEPQEQKLAAMFLRGVLGAQV